MYVCLCRRCLWHDGTAFFAVCVAWRGGGRWKCRGESCWNYTWWVLIELYMDLYIDLYMNANAYVHVCACRFVYALPRVGALKTLWWVMMELSMNANAYVHVCAHVNVYLNVVMGLCVLISECRGGSLWIL